jgi:uncharacterized protein (DUF2249 family)
MEAARSITINSKTRIKVLLEADQENVINILVKLNRNFSKLKNPILRNLFAKRVSISDACKIANCEISDFLGSMQQIGFVIDRTTDNLPKNINKIDFSHAVTVKELDIRPFLEQNQDPLKIILAAVNALGEERLKIINTFEPVPLIDLLSEKGFLYHTDFVSEGMVITWFEKKGIQHLPLGIPEQFDDPSGQAIFNKVLSGYLPHKIKFLDVQQLEMPQPMLLIIEAAKELAIDELLFVHHKKVPVFLLPQLEKEGLTYHFNQKSAIEIEMLIYRR